MFTIGERVWVEGRTSWGAGTILRRSEAFPQTHWVVKLDSGETLTFGERLFTRIGW